MGTLLAVSHRWEHEAVPDGTGAQLNEIQNYLLTTKGASIKYVWYDVSGRPPSQLCPATEPLQLCPWPSSRAQRARSGQWL